MPSCSPAAGPGERTPLWQQRQRAADLLEVASGFPSFPMLLETTRECLRDVFDVPALREVLTEIRSRKLRVVPVETRRASPFAQSLLFGWIAVYMYEGDAPLAERRATALALDRDLLRDLMGAEELRELLDPEVLAELELELQRLIPTRHARHADDLHDLFVDLGPLTLDEVRARCTADPEPWLDQLRAERRVIEIGGRLAAAEDAARLRDALGWAIPQGLPTAFTDPVERPLDDVVARYARTHVPFTIEELTARASTSPSSAPGPRSPGSKSDGRVVFGEFRPGRRRTRMVRHERAPHPAPPLARRAAARDRAGRRHHLRRGSCAPGRARVAAGAAPTRWSRRSSSCRAWPSPRRYSNATCSRPGSTATGRACSTNCARPVSSSGSARARSAPTTAGCACSSVTVCGCWRSRPALEGAPDGEIHDAIRDRLLRAGASFWPDLVAATGTADDTVVLTALWDLVWAGEITNDTFGPLRVPRRDHDPAIVGAGPAASGSARPPRSARGRGPLVAGRAAARTRADARPSGRTRPRCNCSNGKGVVTREAVRAEGAAGGFAGVYPVLRALEESGRARRGWFVAGLGAAQFALPGAVDRLRAHRTIDEESRARVLVLAATDPGAAVRRRAVVARAVRVAPRVRRAPRARSSFSSTANVPPSSNAAARR